MRRLLIGASLALLAIALAARAGEEIVGPARVIDGDTIRIGDTRIRLAGIDAPELDTREGKLARLFLVRALGNQEVRCRDTGERTYKRIVATCSIGTIDLGEFIVREGWARDWPKFSRGRYAEAEAEAQAAGRGIWRGSR